MASPPESQQTVSLPPELQAQFQRLERRLWKNETLLAACAATAALASTWLAVFISDRLWDTPPWFRTLAALAGNAGLIAAAAWWLHRWVFRRRDLRALANLVQRTHRRLGDRLLGIVELALERQHTPGFSPELCRAAIQQVATEATRIDFESAVNPRPARRQAGILGALLSGVAAAILLSPATGWNVLQRWLRPWATLPRRTLVELDGLPPNHIAAHGEPFSLTAHVSYRSWWRPARVSARVPGQPPVLASVENGRIQLKLPGQVEAGTLEVRVGDAIQFTALQPTYRPTLKHLAADVQWPAYLARTNSLEKAEDGTLSVLEGSSVTFHGEASRPLQSAHLRLGQNDAAPLAIKEVSFQSTSAPVANANQAEFTWIDHLGLAAAGPWRLALQDRKDIAPVPELPDLARDVGILETEVLNVKVAARDDFGVRDLGLLLELPPDSDNASAASWPDFKSDTPRPRPLEHNATFAFSPSVFHIPANSTVELRGFATDDLPGRRSTQSPAYRIHVLSNERHAEMVRQNMEALLANLEEVARLEEKVAEDTRNLTELPADKKASREAADRIASTNEEQKQATRNLEQLARDGMRALREAMRNPTFKTDTVSDWAKTLQEMREIAAQEMPEASESLESARQNPGQRSQKLAQAQKQAQKALEKLQGLQKEVNADLDELQALTLAQRLRQLAEHQKSLSSSLRKIVPDSVGLLPSELPPGLARANQRLSTNQTAAQIESTTLQGEIGRFFERTLRPNYGEVVEDMKAAKPSEELDRVRTLIADNIALDAITRLGTWSKKFEGWADKLEPSNAEENAQGGGEGGNSESQNKLLKMLTSLLRTRESQVTLREQTRLLDRQRDPAPRYREDATRLSTQQETLVGQVGKLRSENPAVELGPPLAEAELRMVETLTLLRTPRTDDPTLASHTRSVEALSDVINLINEQAKKNSSSPQDQPSPGDEMKFLTQMMSEQPNVNAGMPMKAGGGGNLSGGDTDSVSDGGPGGTAGRGADGRAPSRAGGAALRNVPSEFREALEDYYRALEQTENPPR